MYNVFNKNATPHQDIYINIFTIYRIIVMMNEEKRKVQLTGGSTLTISLPVKWARAAGIKHGDELSLVQRSDNSLLINTRQERRKANEISNTTTLRERMTTGSVRINHL